MLLQVLSAEGYGKWKMTVVFTDSAHLRRLNRRYRSRDKVTDVISFAMQEGAGSQYGKRILGDVFISLPRARRQAREYKVPFEEELTRLALHGTLHLLGYDHLKPGPAKVMLMKEFVYLGHR